MIYKIINNKIKYHIITYNRNLFGKHNKPLLSLAYVCLQRAIKKQDIIMNA